MANIQQGINQALGMGAAVAGLTGATQRKAEAKAQEAKTAKLESEASPQALDKLVKNNPDLTIGVGEGFKTSRENFGGMLREHVNNTTLAYQNNKTVTNYQRMERAQNALQFYTEAQKDVDKEGRDNTNFFDLLESNISGDADTVSSIFSAYASAETRRNQKKVMEGIINGKE